MIKNNEELSEVTGVINYFWPRSEYARPFGSFHSALCTAFAKADEMNMRRLGLAFPAMYEAFVFAQRESNGQEILEKWVRDYENRR